MSLVWEMTLRVVTVAAAKQTLTTKGHNQAQMGLGTYFVGIGVVQDKGKELYPRRQGYLLHPN
jgi:hypothetical protein